MESLRLPLTQSPEYARTLRCLGVPLRQGFAGSARAPALSWLIQSRRLPVLGHVELLSRGPVARRAADLEDWLPLCRNRRRVPLLLNADGPEAPALRRAGFWPLITPATIALLPLGTDSAMRAAMHPKWRSHLNRLERQALRISRHPLAADHWLLDAEARQARARRYRSLPPGLLIAFAQTNPGKALIWEARHNGAPVAAIAVLRHGRMATWQIGVTLSEGRKRGAMTALLWEAMRWLAGHGHDLLDLGMLNSDDAPGLTRFKLRSGARAHRLGGTWLHLNALAPIARRLPPALAA
ncbi:GNAT family N-acetyltransferase [Salipiger sp. P9]|uniref:GNAT family N-acetyltransferase n=1 Tax=Salipiger pentaromativorans TaxID=2943193 RepID=UPI0021575079|nr:GNAT family N-acetyltransferase [Salipiger pentaromativorans]MCR8547034.1 GNAT family N-acetyltransferase [Salipiger pentaromativorans]